MQSAGLRFSNSKYFQSKNREIFELGSKSFFGGGSGEPIFTKNGSPVKNTHK